MNFLKRTSLVFIVMVLTLSMLGTVTAFAKTKKETFKVHDYNKDLKNHDAKVKSREALHKRALANAKAKYDKDVADANKFKTAMLALLPQIKNTYLAEADTNGNIVEDELMSVRKVAEKLAEEPYLTEVSKKFARQIPIEVDNETYCTFSTTNKVTGVTTEETYDDDFNLLMELYINKDGVITSRVVYDKKGKVISNSLELTKNASFSGVMVDAYIYTFHFDGDKFMELSTLDINKEYDAMVAKAKKAYDQKVAALTKENTSKQSKEKADRNKILKEKAKYDKAKKDYENRMKRKGQKPIYVK